MRSKDTLNALAEVDRQLIETRMQRLLELRAENNLRAMLEYVAEDIVFEVIGDWMALPFSGPVKGKANVAKAMMSLMTQYENLGSTVHSLSIDGENVALRRTARVRHRGTNRVADVAFADFIRFRDGLVIGFSEVADTVTLAELDEI
ncbi:ketosteroid isomerase-like protein [Rhodoblastus acidophilus]|uniref:nuclear transport factor 2 family protein n=1 Tax=Rhodoblastus acidophilus TaxID=1074 RepID=UPI0022243BF8|nr:nuclear transport factor 2 family protein [Rhodoblastus acidophilus]MCW2282421.1 ketosteroid isomerase-like protein [Rhodoblastus acidophilus]MCW2331174.1 ketosteroid isomerase-like protein [Rhodoblastus acidophilus]